MDLWTILIIVGLGLCTFIFVRRIIMIVKFARNCSKEGVIAAKFNFNIGSLFLIAATMFAVASVVYWFGKAADVNEDIVFFEGIEGTELVDVFAKQQEEEQGIVILDPEQYYLQALEKLRSTAVSYTWCGIFLSCLSIYGILLIFEMFCVITNKGFRNYKTEGAIPIFAEYYKLLGKIYIKCNDITGKTIVLTHFKANQKNLASLGQFIVWDEEQTTQEETL